MGIRCAVHATPSVLKFRTNFADAAAVTRSVYFACGLKPRSYSFWESVKKGENMEGLNVLTRLHFDFLAPSLSSTPAAERLASIGCQAVSKKKERHGFVRIILDAFFPECKYAC
jgi:hypothetical protein